MFRCSLMDFMGYSMAVVSVIQELHLFYDDACNYEVRLDGVRKVGGDTFYDVSFRSLQREKDQDGNWRVPMN